jgi:Nif-specific regulatory protein
MAAKLTIKAGNAKPQEYQLSPGVAVKLGRSKSNDVILRDEHVSRLHAEIYQQAGTWMIRDAGGRNGTRVNNKTIRLPTTLVDGALIGIGKTSIRFTADQESGTLAPVASVAGMHRHLRIPDATDLSETVLQPDELSALLGFMVAFAKKTDLKTLIRGALELIQGQTLASAVGFLSLDEDDPLPRMVLPDLESVDMPLSRQLTQKVEGLGRTVWLAVEPAGAIQSESLRTYADAICIPLQAGETPLGALHAYKKTVFFGEKEVQFCEIVAQHLANQLHILRIHRSLVAENSRLRRRLADADELIGESSAIQQVRQQAARLAAVPSPVLICGESGVGKELVASVIHRLSARREGPFVVADCAGVGAEAADREFFGNQRGSVTRIIDGSPPLFQQADEGTLFLDEVVELSPEIQARLLRLLERKPTRNGDSTELHGDVRIIAGTTRNLETEVQSGRFRRELYFRFQSLQIGVPALRSHAEDIPDLVHHFLGKMADEWGRVVKVTDDAMQRLCDYTWPGNIRQLRFALEGAVALLQGDTLDAPDLSALGPAAAPAATLPSLNLEELEALAIRRALAETGSNMTHTARTLGIARDTLANKMRKYHIAK